MTAAATRRQASNAIPSRASSNCSREDEDDDEDEEDVDVLFLGLSTGGPTRLGFDSFVSAVVRGGTERGTAGGTQKKKMVSFRSQSAGRKDYT